MLHAGSHLHDNYQTSVRVSWCLCVHTKPPGLCGRHGNPPLMECCVVCVPYVLTFCETRAHDAGNVSVEPRATLVMLVGVMHGGTWHDAVSCAMQVWLSESCASIPDLTRVFIFSPPSLLFLARRRLPNSCLTGPAPPDLFHKPFQKRSQN